VPPRTSRPGPARGSPRASFPRGAGPGRACARPACGFCRVARKHTSGHSPQ
jgi:hypothetical protein